MADDTSRAILYWLSVGRPLPDILDEPEVTEADVRAAAAAGLAALETAGSARVETRAERIERLRLVWPHAFEPWTPDEDRRLAQEYAHGARVAALARAFGRPPNAVRVRLERLLGSGWRERRSDSVVG